MKNQIVQSLKVIVLALVLSLGLSFVFAQSPFNPPPGGPSASTNTPGPINVGTSAQVKNGPLALDSTLDVGGITTLISPLLALGGTSTTVLNATGNSVFNQDVRIDQDVAIGQALTVNQNSFLKQDVRVGANLLLDSFDKTVFTRGTTGERSLCVNDAGKVILCAEAGCGTAHATYVTSAPTATLDLCASNSTLVGSVSPPFSTPPEYRWTCATGSTNASCFATTPATCGTYVSQPYFTSTPPQGPGLCGPSSFFISPPGITLIDGKFKWQCGKGTSVANCEVPHKLTTSNVSNIYGSGGVCVYEVVNGIQTGNVKPVYSFALDVNSTPSVSWMPVEWTVSDLDNNNATVYQATINTQPYPVYFPTTNRSATSSIMLDSSKFLNKRDYKIFAVVKYGATPWITKTLEIETVNCPSSL